MTRDILVHNIGISPMISSMEVTIISPNKKVKTKHKLDRGLHKGHILKCDDLAHGQSGHRLGDPNRDNRTLLIKLLNQDEVQTAMSASGVYSRKHQSTCLHIILTPTNEIDKIYRVIHNNLAQKLHNLLTGEGSESL